MTYHEYVEKIQKQFAGKDVSHIKDHLAYQFNIKGEGEGAFYVEIKDGKLYIEPYEYYDRDAMFTATQDTYDKILSGKKDPVAAFTLGKLKVDGSIEKALRIKEIIG